MEAIGYMKVICKKGPRNLKGNNVGIRNIKVPVMNFAVVWTIDLGGLGKRSMCRITLFSWWLISLKRRKKQAPIDIKYDVTN